MGQQGVYHAVLRGSVLSCRFSSAQRVFEVNTFVHKREVCDKFGRPYFSVCDKLFYGQFTHAGTMVWYHGTYHWHAPWYGLV